MVGFLTTAKISLLVNILQLLIRVYSIKWLAFTTASRASSTLGLILECPSRRRVATNLKGPSYPI
jgi:hypothetical protein